MTVVNEIRTTGESQSGAEVVRTVSLSKTYPGAARPAVDGVDLHVDPGEMVAIMGPSGCGKSTLLHLLGGLDGPTAGQVWFGDQRVDGLSEGEWAILRRSKVGFVFQFFNLVANLSVADNVELPALLSGRRPREARARREALLDELGLGDLAGVSPSRLSGGEQQRVALARALVNRPALLLADEPTGALDTAGTRQVLELLRRYHREGQTVLVVTHDPRVAGAADRVLIMRDGALVDETRMEGRDGRVDLLAGLIELED